MKTFIKINLLIVMLLVSGCVTPVTKTVTYKVTSSPSEAKIDVDGAFVGNTPVSVKFKCKEVFVGLAAGGFAQTSETFNVTASPIKGNEKPQTKNINPCESTGDIGEINFNF